MKNREQLREQYEDALFAMMMGELASREGEKALEENKRLQDDPAAAVPGQIDRKCMQTIRGHFRKNHIRKAGRTARKALGIAAMVFGIFSALFVGAFALSEDVRLGTMNLVVKTFSGNTDFYFAPFTNDKIPQIKAGWVPEGFILNSEGSNEMSSWFVYGNDNGQYIRGRYTLIDGQVVSFDTEDVNVKQLQIGTAEATLTNKEGKVQITWASIENNGFITVFSDGLSEEELIQVAQNATF